MALSMDIRHRIIKAWQAGHSTSQIALRLEVSQRTVREFKRRWRENRLEPQRPGPRRPTKITPEDQAILRQKITENPGITLQQLANAISVQVVESTIHRVLKRMDISFKKSRSLQPNSYVLISSDGDATFASLVNLLIRVALFFSMNPVQKRI